MKTKNLILYSALACLGVVLTAQADDRINMALASNGSVAAESSNPWGYGPGAAIDGLLRVGNTSKELTHTFNGDSEWWQVNLGASKTISEVRVWFRTDAITWTNRDSALQLIIYSDATLATVVYSTNFDGSTAPLPYRNMILFLPAPVAGQVVRIGHLPGLGGTDSGYLALSEVQVFNQSVEEVNLALGGTATMSSSLPSGWYGASCAIDGLVPTFILGGYQYTNLNISTAETAGTEIYPLLPQWQVDLGSNQSIREIRVFTPADVDPTNNDDLAVMVFNNASSLVASNYNAVHSPTVSLPGNDFATNKQYLVYTFSPPITGEFVQVAHTLPNAGILALSEVEVFKSYSTQPGIDIAQGPTNQIVEQNHPTQLTPASAMVSNANLNYLSYQWQSNGVDIAGANGTTYTVPPLAQVGNYNYGVKYILPGFAVTTQAVITVVPDVTPPYVVASSFSTPSDGVVMMTIKYSELVTPASATNTANYAFASPGTYNSLTLLPDGKTVTLIVNNLLSYDAYSLGISGVQDLTLNTIVTTNLTGTLPPVRFNYSSVAIALGGGATESSNPWGYSADNAIDGDITTFCHTLNENGEWWQEDLGTNRSIGELDIYFRGSFRDRDQNILVSVFDSGFNLLYQNFLGTNIPPQPSYLAITPAVTGEYVQVAHPANIGIAGTDEGYLCLAEVMVYTTPNGLGFLTQPQSVSVPQNSPASFSVVAQGPSPIYYQWQHPAGVNLLGETNATLVIPNAGPAQAGDYICIASNATRVRTSNTATLTLVPSALLSISPGPTTNNVTLSWNVTGYSLQQNTSLTNGVGWVNVFGNVAGGDISPVTNTMGSSPMFFRLAK